VFPDHDKNAYLSDLELIIDAGWLHPGSVIVADNILVPGAPAYRHAGLLVMALRTSVRCGDGRV
jgi:predicted O-methyltransferase YrrM